MDNIFQLNGCKNNNYINSNDFIEFQKKSVI